MPSRCASVSASNASRPPGRVEGAREVGGQRGVARGLVRPELDLDHVADACGRGGPDLAVEEEAVGATTARREPRAEGDARDLAGDGRVRSGSEGAACLGGTSTQ